MKKRCAWNFQALLLAAMVMPGLGGEGTLLRAAEPALPSPQQLDVPEFASEPIAMAWDTRPRLWLLESVSSAAGRHSRLCILEEIPGASVHFRVKVFADNLPSSTGFEWSEQGIVLGGPSALMFLQDTNRDDVADSTQILVTGFFTPAQQGRLTSFVWGPDSWLYFLNEGAGVTSLEPRLAGVAAPKRAGCGVLRYHVANRQLEVFSDGPLNPVGLSFDPEGDLFVATRARESFFHVVGGGNHVPRNSFPGPIHYHIPRLGPIGDVSLNRYGAYGLLMAAQEPVAAHFVPAAVLLLTNSPNQVDLQIRRDGAGFKARAGSRAPVAILPWGAMKESFSYGPEGALWIRRGKGLLRLVSEGSALSPSTAPLSQLRSAALVPLLEQTNLWTRAWARRRLIHEATAEDRESIVRLMRESRFPLGRLECLWTLSAMKPTSGEVVGRALVDSDPVLRAWAVRLWGERRQVTVEIVQALQARARDQDPTVRREVAIALRRLAEPFSFATNDPAAMRSVSMLAGVIEPLILASAGEGDEVVNTMVWAAFEQFLAADAGGALQVLRRVGDAGLSLSGDLLSRSVQRMFGSRDSAAVDLALDYLLQISEESPALCAAGLAGMMQGQKSSKLWTTHRGVKRLLSRLSGSPNPELAGAARQVDAFCGNPGAQNAILSKINDPKLSEEERLKAIRFSEVIPSEFARSALLEAIQSTNAFSLQLPALEVLREIGKTEDIEKLVRRWDGLSASLRSAASEILVSKVDWVGVLLRGLEERRVRPDDLSPQATARLREHPHLKVRARALAALASAGR